MSSNGAMFRLIAIGMLALFSLSSSWAQTPELARVQAAHESLKRATNQEDRLSLHDQLIELWEEALAAGSALQVDWRSWNEAVVKLEANDGIRVVFTWNVELDDRTQRYGGWVVQEDDRNPLGYVFVMLQHDLATDPGDLSRMHRHDRWQGGLYYDGVVTYDKDEPVFTLLAWDGADALTNRKWVETMHIRNGRVRFGSPQFELPEGLQKRKVLTYADAVQATLRIERDPVRIVMDHLAPEDPSFRGQHAFYGPTLSYDGLEWKKGRWHFVRDIQVQNDGDSSPREYRDPSRIRSRRRN